MHMLPPQAPAAVVCQADSTLGNKVEVAVTLFEQPVTATVTVKAPDGSTVLHQTYENLASVYDGHESGLVTGPGFAFKYADDYGCIRKVDIVTDTRGGTTGFIETMHVAVCQGGTTPDDICR